MHHPRGSAVGPCGPPCVGLLHPSPTKSTSMLECSTTILLSRRCPQHSCNACTRWRSVLRGISESNKALHVVDASAGTGKSHLAQCLINRWGSLRDSNQGFLLITLRARNLRTEFLESLLSDKAAVLNNIIILLSCRPHFASALMLRSLLARSLSLALLPRSSFEIIMSGLPASHQPRPDHVLRPVAGPLVAGRRRA